MKKTLGSAWLSIALVAAAIWCAGCGAKLLAFSPDVSPLPVPEARQIVQRFLEEQPGEHAPASIEITEQKISITSYVTRRYLLPRGVVAPPQTSTLYLDNLGKTELFRDGDWFIVRVFDKDGRLFLRAFSRNEERAKQFLNAVMSLAAR